MSATERPAVPATWTRPDVAKQRVEASAEAILRGVAETLARYQPKTWRLLLTHHVAGSDGRCRACRTSSRGAPIWPCALWIVADQARRLTR